MNALATAPQTHRGFKIVRPWLHVPAMRGVIERRVLVNFRCDPTLLADLLPAPFRPKLVQGWGVAGICLIRLGGIRPGFLPAAAGLTSENAAHRIAVEWDENDGRREGVFIPRRDTNSRINELAGGRLFPGVHHRARFDVWETDHWVKLQMRSEDGRAAVRVFARTTTDWPTGSVFRSLDEASAFFRAGALGWSARTESDAFDGLELHCGEWRMEPLTVDRVESSFFDDCERFPAGAAAFDSAFLMRGLPHEWRARGRLIQQHSC